MTGADLCAEYRAALHGTTLRDLRPLRDAGIGTAGLALAPAYARVQLSRDAATFTFDPDSDLVAFILPVRHSNPLSPEAADPELEVAAGPIVDLLAFSPHVPGCWALRIGSACWLGAVEPQYLMPDPVPIWRTPMHWLGNDCRGLVLLSPDKRDRYRVLTCLDSIVAEDELHARELRGLLAQPWLAPPVYVRQAREVRRAA